VSNGPNILVDAPARPSSSSRAVAPDVAQAWRWIGWLSLALALAGLGDWVLAWIPMRFGNVEWEFATITSTMAGLPLITLGIAGLAGSAVARGVRWQVRVVAILVLIWAAVVLGVLLVFLLDVPIALKMVQGPARLGILKASTKTIYLGLLFSTIYCIVGVGALRRMR
jgi:hypothetical protein